MNCCKFECQSNKCCECVYFKPKEKEERRYVIQAVEYCDNKNLPFLKTKSRIDLSGPLTKTEAHDIFGTLKRDLHLKHVIMVRLSDAEFYRRINEEHDEQWR